MKILQLAAVTVVSALALAGCQKQSGDMGLDPAPTAVRSSAAPTTSSAPASAKEPTLASSAPVTEPQQTEATAEPTDDKPAATSTVENSEPPQPTEEATAPGAEATDVPQPTREPTTKKSGADTVAVAPGYTVVIPAGFEAVASEEWADLTMASGDSNIYTSQVASEGDLASDAKADAAGWTEKYGGTTEMLSNVPQVGGLPAAGFRVRLDDGYTIVGYVVQRNGRTYGVYLDTAHPDVDAQLPKLDAVAKSLAFT